MEGISCGQFTFYNEFDSANLGKIEYVPQTESVLIKHSNKCLIQELFDAEFNIWTKPDCCGTEFENGNRTWFYFGVKAPFASQHVRFNMVDLNRQGKMYSQGMAPVYRIVPSKPKWERITDKPVYNLADDIFTLTFKFRTPENPDSVMYFAFTYPFSFTDLEKMLLNIDSKYLSITPTTDDEIYYVKETVCRTIEGRSIDLLTISSHHGITKQREERLKNLFMDDVPRPFKFVGKKIIFVSARVHPGETPSSFVFNGLLSLLLNRDDLIAQNLRKLYVFKMIPFLNPDGVARGHYRTDNRGINLNRVYLNPNLKEHPSVYAARALIRYHHFGFEKEDIIPKCENCKTQSGNQTDASLTEDEDIKQNDLISSKVSRISLKETDSPPPSWCTKWHNFCRNCGAKLKHSKSKEEVNFEKVIVGAHGDENSNESGLFMYLDLHGHASKKGIFMYGNHFDDLERNVECMLFPKLMTINNHHFHFNSCNFTERNMYLRDRRDGMSRAGSGRVAVLSITGIIKSYTLECNYNTGRIVNILPPTIKEPHGKMHSLPVPPKYTPQIFEDVGRSLGASILDLTSQNPCSRVPNSEFHTLSGLRDWIRTMCTDFSCENRPKMRMRHVPARNSQGETTRRNKNCPAAPQQQILKKSKTRNTVLNRKENLAQPSCSKSGMRLNKCFKVKLRKDLNLKAKNASTEKFKLINKANKKNCIQGTSNKEKVDIQIPATKVKKPVDSDSLHLREICFIKNNEGKAVIAKYDNKDFDDSLVVSWDKSSNKPHLFTHKSRVSSAPPYVLNKHISEPSTSKQVVRVHNFVKGIPSKTKLKKNLRRFASSADVLGKIDKKKRKFKSK
ncbi:unnamed protein product [Phaedon cochleariae]|uniref:tubulin-glutamate carboxypeptidase n=1 Tax=Phaedon cochleariae TaxID=80249 RepID=A0A9P0DRK3_PHACE|nr:unnamed protein product [Phaedon cochleariae]